MPAEPAPRRRASDRDPGAFRTRIEEQYASPWERLSAFLRGPAGAPSSVGAVELVRPLRPFERWLARRDQAWVTRYARRGQVPSPMWRRPPAQTE